MSVLCVFTSNFDKLPLPTTYQRCSFCNNKHFSEFNRHSYSASKQSLCPPIMVSLLRTLRSIRRVGIKEWWHQMQGIGDAKSGKFVGADSCVNYTSLAAILTNYLATTVGLGTGILKI